MSGKLPLLATTTPHHVIAWRRGQAITQARFLQEVRHVSQHLPAGRFICNLCEDRYLFLVAFAAVGIAGQTNLLPSSRASLHLQRLATEYPHSHRMGDDDIQAWLARSPVNEDGVAAVPELPGEQVLAIAFTSGSTGASKPNPKTWGELVSGARQARQRFGFAPNISIVATVPPQHMYGLETSIMTVLGSGVGVYGGRPFFPEDVRAALASVPAPRVLVTTPIHLQACIEADLSWPLTAFVISATAPLSANLATQAEVAWGAPVLEIYGCTEAGSIASRRTVEGDSWRLYDGFALQNGLLCGAHLSAPTPLNDLIEADSEASFKLLGRREDMVNIAGKRSSLGYLNHQLNEIPGVVEGVFWLPEAVGSDGRRLAAVVVAPSLSERQLLDALALRLDPVFLPRPLLKVAALPRNETGKVTREILLALLNKPQSSGKAADGV
jgi:acyl-coenzyme A synthetase/AMP-(fatty) acid ligase